MAVPELKLHPAWVRIITSASILVCTFLLFRCGGSNDNKKPEETPTVTGPEIPGDWNGTNDWSGSQWKVIEE